jgi:hypothetical protein
VSVHLTEAEMIAYANERARLGHRLLDAHVSDGTGCCQACGRTHPCPDRRYGGDLLVHFDQWWCAPPVLVRPYVPDPRMERGVPQRQARAQG